MRIVPPPGRPVGALRWLGAAALALVQFAYAWDYEIGLAGTTTLINQYNPYTGGLDLVPYYIPGTPGELVFGFQAPVRVFLLIAVAASLAAAAGFGGRLARRAAIGGLIASLVLALSAHEGGVVLALGLALALVGRPLWDWVRPRLVHPPARAAG